MKKIIPCLLAVCLCLSLFSACRRKNTSVPEAVCVGAGMPPLTFLIDRIAGGTVRSVCALPPGRSAHDYEPTARETATLQSCRVYFSAGLPYEKRLIKSLSNSKIVDLTADLPVLLRDPDDPDEADPHIWLHPANNLKMAETVALELARLQPEKKALFDANLKAFQAEQNAVAAECTALLAANRGNVFFIQHPSLGYFAAFCGLRQCAIEAHASGISAKHLSECAERARAARVRAVLTQKEANSSPARVLAQAIGARVVEVDPLGYNLFANLRAIAAAVKESLPNE